MNRLLVTGDTHGEIDFSKLNTKNFSIQKELDKSDTLIICGDVALCWHGNKKDHYLKKWYEDKNFTTLAIDGNHENHVAIAKLPIVNKFGGRVRKVSDTVFYAIRGEVYEIAEKKILAFGGADSSDIQFRKEGVSWWREETITEEDLNNAMKNLEKHDYKIDYIMTHTSGSELCKSLGYQPSHSDLIVDLLLRTVDYKKHYCGHLHDDLSYGNTRLIYNDIVEITDNFKEE